ncbi:MAG TPA: ion transporter [Burkholderiaceae bacterium]|nr:ion transporter [Burkholderiaceae bacterium]
MSDFRRRLFHALEPSHRAAGLSHLNRFIVVMILVSVLFVIAESEQAIHDINPTLFHAVEIAFGLLFLIEYVARVWVAAEDPRYSDGFKGRLRYAVTPSALLDLLAVTPLFLHAMGAEAYVIRILRVVRVLRLAKLGRFTVATRALSHAVHARRYELLISFGVAIFILVLASTLMYIVEGHTQPEVFGSIPRAMWWAIATLTTVGYGDAVPMTLPGRILGGITAVTGVGLIAMPAGILAAAMSDAIHTRRAAEHKEALERAHKHAAAVARSPEPAEGERDG